MGYKKMERRKKVDNLEALNPCSRKRNCVVLTALSVNKIKGKAKRRRL